MKELVHVLGVVKVCLWFWCDAATHVSHCTSQMGYGLQPLWSQTTSLSVCSLKLAVLGGLEVS